MVPCLSCSVLRCSAACCARPRAAACQFWAAEVPLKQPGLVAHCPARQSLPHFPRPGGWSGVLGPLQSPRSGPGSAGEGNWTHSGNDRTFFDFSASFWACIFCDSSHDQSGPKPSTGGFPHLILALYPSFTAAEDFSIFLCPFPHFFPVSLAPLRLDAASIRRAQPLGRRRQHDGTGEL